MIKQVSPEQALARLEQLCVRSEHCTGELRSKLRNWRIMPDDAETVIYSLKRRRFVDDERFTRAFVRDKYKLGHWGRQKIRMALRAKGIPAEMIDEAFDEIDPEEYEASLAYVVKAKARTICDEDPYMRRQKILRAVVARGFETSLAIKYIKLAFSAQ